MKKEIALLTVLVLLVGAGTVHSLTPGIPSEELPLVLDITPNITNLFTTTITNLEYGIINITNTSITTPIGSAGVWFNITGITSGELFNNITTNGNNSLVINTAGVYEITYTTSFSGGTNNVYHTTVSINNIPQPQCLSDRKTGGGGDVGAGGGTCLLELAVNDQITPQVLDETAADDVMFQEFHMIVKRIG